MAKTETTIALEAEIHRATSKLGVFSCFEVTIGFGGKERVDYMTYDTKGVWRCYEVKASLADFRSRAKATFCGHYNYYVLTPELYEKVKGELPAHVGAYVRGACVRKARRQELAVDETVLLLSLVRSLSRETDKALRSGRMDVLGRAESRVRLLERENKQLEGRLRDLERALYARFGRRWADELDLE